MPRLLSLCDTRLYANYPERKILRKNVIQVPRLHKLKYITESIMSSQVLACIKKKSKSQIVLPRGKVVLPSSSQNTTPKHKNSNTSNCIFV